MRFHIQEVTVDLKNFGMLRRFSIKWYLFLFNIVEKVYARFQRAVNRDYPEKPRDFLFHDAKETPMFREFTYLKKRALFTSLLFKKQLTLKIIYLRNIVILLQTISNPCETSLKSAIENFYEQEKMICNDAATTSYVNQHEPSTTLPNCTHYKIHKVIICKQDHNHLMHSSTHLLITSEEITTHIFNEKEYYFILNYLLTIHEVHNGDSRDKRKFATLAQGLVYMGNFMAR